MLAGHFCETDFRTSSATFDATAGYPFEFDWFAPAFFESFAFRASGDFRST